MAATKKRDKKTKKIKRLALVVHGLGEQGAGDTLDDLAGGLWGARDDLRVSSDMRLMQDIDQPNPRKLATFPCHVRRYSDPATPHNPHTTFAEVYWADLSSADKGAFRIFYGLIKAILGLGHIVRAGAQQYFGEGDTKSSRCANLIPYLLHGPVAAVNVALATGAIFLFAVTKLFGATKDKVWESAESVQWSICRMLRFAETKCTLPVDGGLSEFGICLMLLLAGLLLCLVGYLLKKKSDVYYFRIFSVWVVIYGALMATLAFLQFYGWVDDTIKLFAVEALLGTVKDPTEFTAGYLWFGVVLLLCVKLAWLLMIIALVILTGATGWRLLRNKKTRSAERSIRQVPPLHLIIPCAMLWLWMLVIATIWVVVYKSGNFKAEIDETLLNVGVRMLVMAMAGVVLVTTGVAATLFGRWRWRKPFKNLQTDINAEFAAHPVPRLLLSRGIVAGVMLTGTLFVASAVIFLLEALGVGLAGELSTGLDQYLPAVLAVAAGIGGLAFTQREGIAQALGVGKDLITYFKVEPTERGKKIGEGAKMGVFSSPTNYAFNNFRQRRRIHGRMQKVLMALWPSDDFDELIVISHSQGTIIATEFAKELHKGKDSLVEAAACEVLAPVMKEATLVTMGSPFTHVYNYYLPSEFGGPKTVVKDEMIEKWINIFRIDDFIGTYIGAANLKGDWPKNQAVPGGGHTRYWTDGDVITHLQPLFAQP